MIPVAYEAYIPVLSDLRPCNLHCLLMEAVPILALTSCTLPALLCPPTHLTRIMRSSSLKLASAPSVARMSVSRSEGGMKASDAVRGTVLS